MSGTTTPAAQNEPAGETQQEQREELVNPLAMSDADFLNQSHPPVGAVNGDAGSTELSPKMGRVKAPRQILSLRLPGGTLMLQRILFRNRQSSPLFHLVLLQRRLRQMLGKAIRPPSRIRRRQMPVTLRQTTKVSTRRS